MAAKTEATLISDIAAAVLSGGRRTTAANVRTLLADILDSYANIVDGGQIYQAEVGYSSVFNPTQNTSFVTKKWVTDNFVALGGIGSLSQTLAVGNNTGAYNIIVDTDQQVKFGSGTAGITNLSYIIDPNHVIIHSDIGLAKSYLMIKDGANSWSDQTINGFISIASGASNAIQLDTVNDYINVFTGANGLNLYAPKITILGVTSTSATGSGALVFGTSPVFSSGITIDGITVGLGAGSVVNNTVIGAGAFVANTTGARNTIIGASAAVTQSTANEVVAIGRQTANFNTAHQTTAVGTYALYNNTTGTENTALGFQAGNNNQTGNNNVFIGWGAGYSVTGSNCTIIGFNAGRNTTGSNNTFIGRQAGLTNTTGTDNIFIGFQSGYYETGSSKLFIDNVQRASEADARTKALIYGVFAATTAAQTLSLNAVVTISENLVTPIHYGATTASGTLTLYSTSNATKGKILFGTSGYDEVNNRLGVGNSIPAHPLDVTGKINASGEISGSFFSLSGATLIDNSAGTVRIAVSGGFTGIGLLKDITITDAKNIILNTTTGTKIGTGTTQKLSFWNATPIVQPTTGVAAATLVGGGGTTLTDTDTFDGYTLKQIVKALRNTGLLA